MTKETKETLKDRGYGCLKDYIRDMADEYEVDYKLAEELAILLGESELFDGFINALEDAEAFD